MPNPERLQNVPEEYLGGEEKGQEAEELKREIRELENRRRELGERFRRSRELGNLGQTVEKKIDATEVQLERVRERLMQITETHTHEEVTEKKDFDSKQATTLTDRIKAAGRSFIRPIDRFFNTSTTLTDRIKVAGRSFIRPIDRFFNKFFGNR